ncbi:MAG TPA: cupredoxin domain-containing protein [Mycobacterium sp.]|jgi:plastocyanin
MKKICTFSAAMILVAGIATACGGSNSTDETTDTATATSGATATSENSPTATAGATITIENMAFGEPLTVAPGAEIALVNNDSVEHSVTSDAAGAFDVDVEGKEKGTLTAPSQPGEYPFHCTYHPNMKGTLIVK